MLDVDMHEAKVIVPKRPLAFGRQFGGGFGSVVKARFLENAPDTVAIEVWQEVADDEGKVIERKVGFTAHGTDDRTLFIIRLPGQPVRTR